MLNSERKILETKVKDFVAMLPLTAVRLLVLCSSLVTSFLIFTILTLRIGGIKKCCHSLMN